MICYVCHLYIINKGGSELGFGVMNRTVKRLVFVPIMGMVLKSLAMAVEVCSVSVCLFLLFRSIPCFVGASIPPLVGQAIDCDIQRLLEELCHVLFCLNLSLNITVLLL